MHHLYKPQSLDDPFLSLIKDDPVRPEIPVEFRLSNRSEIFILMEDDKPLAVLCVAYCDSIPTNCAELLLDPVELTSVIFYTVWSYVAGAGKEIVLNAAAQIKEQHENIKRFVTLSPKTEMAKRFHLKNGASIFRENSESFNYEYSI